MNVRRFIAPTARDCLRKVKEALGPDAIVVSNKPVSGGVEIMAMTAEGFETLSRQTSPRDASSSSTQHSAPPAPSITPRQSPASPVAPHPKSNFIQAVGAKSEAGSINTTGSTETNEDDYTVRLSGQARKQPLFHPSWQNQVAPTVTPQPERPRLRPLPRSGEGVLSGAEVQATLKSAILEEGTQKLVQSPPSIQSQLQVSQLMGEMQTIKTLLERQLAGFAWGEMSREAPTRALALAEMLDAGFSGLLARKLCQEMPVDLNMEDARKWLKSAINRRLRTLGSDSDIIDRGGVYALVGPTGVGKTTTTAKLAARCVVRYGADKIALLTTDGYRIGAHEQLRIYGRILGVPVHVVRDGDDLRHTLADLRDKHMVLIDTVGMSQRDRMVAEQAAMLMRAGEVNRLLLLNATSRGDTLDDVVRAYAGEDLAGVILSKVDETASIAPTLDAVVRHGLLLCYVANGQRVPEDLHLPNRQYLMHRAFKLPEESSPHLLKDEEAGMALAPSGMSSPAMSKKVAGGLFA